MKNKNSKHIDFLKKMFSKPPQTALGIKKIIKIDPILGQAEAIYKARKNMCHSGNIVQGGFITGWLDAVMALACMSKVGADTLVLSLEIKTTFIKKIIPEPVFVLGNVDSIFFKITMFMCVCLLLSSFLTFELLKTHFLKTTLTS